MIDMGVNICHILASNWCVKDNLIFDHYNHDNYTKNGVKGNQKVKEGCVH